MEALIAKAIPALREVLGEQAFEKCTKVEDSLAEFEKSNNPIMEFFDELDEADYLNEPIKFVYQKYSTFCLSNNLQAMSAIEFQKQMKRQYEVVVKSVEMDGKRVRVYAYEG
jgi:putative DNA primase/helicase